MYNLKGFMSYDSLSDNAVNIIAPLGELSTHCKTFSREVGTYTSGLYPDATFVAFKSARDTAPVGLLTVPTLHAAAALEIGQWIYNRSISGDLTDDDALLYDAFVTQFDQLVGDVVLGPVETDGEFWMPGWVQYRLLSDTEPNKVKFWLSDDTFSRQYDEYELEFVAPIDNLDDFFKGSLQVKALVEARTQTQTFIKVEQVKNRKPETLVRSESYEYIDPLDRTWRLPTDWTFVIWGPAGDNNDIIKEALIAWILANSTHTRNEWAVILPDIFTSTEFIITPMWGQYSVSNRTIQAGIYSPTTTPARALEIAAQTCKGFGYSVGHLNLALTVSSCMYKSLAFLACGGAENRDGKIRFNQQFPDYMTIPFGDPDFDRMSPETQDWIELLNRLLIVAEHMDRYSDIPLGFSRLEREGILYVTATYMRVQYLVVARSCLDLIDPPHVG